MREVKRDGLGSGFLIKDNIWLGHNHVFAYQEEAQAAESLFNYQQNLLGRRAGPNPMELDPATYIDTSPEAGPDFSLVKA